MLGNDQEAEDGTVETFRRILVGLDQKPKGDKERVWVFQIVRRVGFRAAGNTARRKARLSDLGDDLDAIAWTDPGVNQVVDRDLVSKMLAQLPDGQRSAVYLCVGLEYTCEEAARILNVPVGTVKSWVMRALVRMRQRAVTGQHQESTAT